MKPKQQLIGLKLIILCVALCTSTSISPAQPLQWAKRAGGSGEDIAFSVASGANGEIYAVGEFNGTATFGLGEANETPLIATAGSYDVFIAKYSAQGSLTWAISVGGAGEDIAGDIAVHADGSVYVSGGYSGAATFGPGPGGTLDGASGENIFIARYNPDSSLAWVKSAGGPCALAPCLEEEQNGLAVDASGDVYVTGRFENDIAFGRLTASPTVLGANSAYCKFIAKYDASGNVLWAKRIVESLGGGPIFDSIASAASGNIIAIGGIGGSATFEPDSAFPDFVFGLGNNAIFITAYEQSGAPIWKSFVTTEQGYIAPMSVAVDLDNAILASGLYQGTIAFAPGGINETRFTSSNNGESLDSFIAKYNPDGTFSWARSVVCDAFDEASAIVADSQGYPTVVGLYEGPITFGRFEPSKTTINTAGDRDIYLAKYNSDGTFLSATRAGGPLIDTPFNIAVNSRDQVIICGYSRSTAVFGLGEGTETSLVSAGDTDIFIADYFALENHGSFASLNYRNWFNYP